jgi:hypothetical protein
MEGDIVAMEQNWDIQTRQLSQLENDELIERPPKCSWSSHLNLCLTIILETTNKIFLENLIIEPFHPKSQSLKGSNIFLHYSNLWQLG